MKNFDLIVVGGGASGMIAAITAARLGSKVLLLEKLAAAGAKLKATGGGRCNLANTLGKEDFMARFGREGRFMGPALSAMDHHALMAFFSGIGVECHAPDGQRVFPVTHNSATIISALENEMKRLGILVLCSQKVSKLIHDGKRVSGVKTHDQSFTAANVIIATGGLGYPMLGAEGDGYNLATAVGHKITELFPAMLPLRTKETWVKGCRADTIGKAELRLDLPGEEKLYARGDLIFTSDGIRGPVVLDFAREISPLLKKYGEVPILANFTQGMNEEGLKERLKIEHAKKPHGKTIEHLSSFMPKPLAGKLCMLAGIDPAKTLSSQPGKQREKLIKILAWTPLTITGHEGFAMAMITRGGVSLKEICPETMESKLLRGLYFCGEIVNLDGPCGGFNLQWSFSSGFLAGHLSEKNR